MSAETLRQTTPHAFRALVSAVPCRGLQRLQLIEEPGVVGTEAQSQLQAAGLVFALVRSEPLRIHGGTAVSGGPPPYVYRDWFMFLGRGDRFEVFSTSPRGVTVDESSYASLRDAVDALVGAYAATVSSPRK